mmetsp:Transcript_15500/g.27538  ORF Transcript_15500/g.27538 Transcript_15500/m.27538 type:complete len:107 (+) Transcript_15500:107-427(+)
MASEESAEARMVRIERMVEDMAVQQALLVRQVAHDQAKFSKAMAEQHLQIAKLVKIVTKQAEELGRAGEVDLETPNEKSTDQGAKEPTSRAAKNSSKATASNPVAA